jgi:hypothetical protein
MSVRERGVTTNGVMSDGVCVASEPVHEYSHKEEHEKSDCFVADCWSHRMFLIGDFAR